MKGIVKIFVLMLVLISLITSVNAVVKPIRGYIYLNDIVIKNAEIEVYVVPYSNTNVGCLCKTYSSQSSEVGEFVNDYANLEYAEDCTLLKKNKGTNCGNDWKIGDKVYLKINIGGNTYTTNFVLIDDQPIQEVGDIKLYSKKTETTLVDQNENIVRDNVVSNSEDSGSSSNVIVSSTNRISNNLENQFVDISKIIYKLEKPLTFDISIESKNQSNVNLSIEIKDVTGQSVKTLNKNVELSKGTNNLDLQTELNEGLYTYTVVVYNKGNIIYATPESSLVYDFNKLGKTVIVENPKYSTNYIWIFFIIFLVLIILIVIQIYLRYKDEE